MGNSNCRQSAKIFQEIIERKRKKKLRQAILAQQDRMKLYSEAAQNALVIIVQGVRPRYLDQFSASSEKYFAASNDAAKTAALQEILTQNSNTVDTIRLVEASATTGKMVLEALRGLQEEYSTHVLSVHGPGLFISIHLQDPETGEPAIALADGIAVEAVRRGVLMFTTGRGMLKFTPPLSIDPEAAMEAV